MRKAILPFVLGILVGVVLSFVGWRSQAKRFHNPEKRYSRMLEHFSRKLDLRADQKTAVGKILSSKREKIQVMRSETGPKFDEVRRSTNEEIRKLLTPKQQEKFDKLQAKWEERRKRRRAWHDGK